MSDLSTWYLECTHHVPGTAPRDQGYKVTKQRYQWPRERSYVCQKFKKVIITTLVRCMREGNVLSRVCDSVHMSRRRVEGDPMPQCTGQLSHDAIEEGPPLSRPTPLPPGQDQPRRTSQKGWPNSPPPSPPCQQPRVCGTGKQAPPPGILSCYGIEFAVDSS